MDLEHSDWVERLTRSGPQREEAIGELREILVRGLSVSLARRYGTTLPLEDVAQEAVIKILNSLHQFEGRSRFVTWAMTIATRIGISELRHKRYRDVSLESLSTDETMNVDVEDPQGGTDASELDRVQILSRLRELIETELTDKQKTAIGAHLEGMPVEEIAKKTNSNRNAVYKLVHDARMRLRTGLEKSGVMADDVNAIFS